MKAADRKFELLKALAVEFVRIQPGFVTDRPEAAAQRVADFAQEVLRKAGLDVEADAGSEGEDELAALHRRLVEERLKAGEARAELDRMRGMLGELAAEIEQGAKDMGHGRLTSEGASRRMWRQSQMVRAAARPIDQGPGVVLAEADPSAE